MANPPRTRKRVHALRRAPDGSAFQKCDCCEAMVSTALVNMHDCEAKGKHKMKRFKGVCEKPKLAKQGPYSDQVRSPFRFFKERFVETCISGECLDIDRKGFETWKIMWKKEKPYVTKAEMLDAAQRRALLKEVTNMPKFADSVMVGKYDKDCSFKSYAPILTRKILKCSDCLGFECLSTYDWKMNPWIWKKSQSRWQPFLEVLG